MKELNKNSSKEEIQAYINNIVQRDKKQIVEFDELKTKVLKYIVYKKRTEKEVRQKFSSSSIDQNLLDDVIESLKENGYINDDSYIQRAMNEFLAINTLSLKEIRNKLYAKGIESDIIDTYFSNHEEQLEEYEMACARRIAMKKQTQMERQDIENFLYRKGYSKESIQEAYEDEGMK